MRNAALALAVLLLCAAAPAPQDAPLAAPAPIQALDAATCCIPGHICPPDAPMCPYCPGPLLCVDPAKSCTQATVIQGCDAKAVDALIQKSLAKVPCADCPPLGVANTMRNAWKWRTIGTGREVALKAVAAWFERTFKTDPTFCPKIPSTGLSTLSLSTVEPEP